MKHTTCTACGFTFPRPQARPTCQSERACARRAGSVLRDIQVSQPASLVVTNASLSETAFARAALEPGFVPGGTLTRRIVLSAASALRHTSTPDKAKSLLAEILRNADVRDGAIAYIDELVLGA